MTDDELIEAVAGAHRERDADGAIAFHPSWRDLDDAGRRAAYDAAFRLRRIEAAVDPEGMSSTGHAVLDRIRGRSRP